MCGENKMMNNFSYSDYLCELHLLKRKDALSKYMEGGARKVCPQAIIEQLGPK